jgi:hypothetical protein
MSKNFKDRRNSRVGLKTGGTSKNDVEESLHMVNPKYTLVRRLDPGKATRYWIVYLGKEEIIRRPTLRQIYSWVTGSSNGVKSKIDEMKKRIDLLGKSKNQE